MDDLPIAFAARFGVVFVAELELQGQGRRVCGRRTYLRGHDLPEVAERPRNVGESR